MRDGLQTELQFEIETNKTHTKALKEHKEAAEAAQRHAEAQAAALAKALEEVFANDAAKYPPCLRVYPCML